MHLRRKMQRTIKIMWILRNGRGIMKKKGGEGA